MNMPQACRWGGLGSEILYIDRSGLRAGSRVLVIGAGGSIGTMAIQLLKRLGAEVTAVDTGKKFAVMQEAGADRLIDYTETDYFHGEAQYNGIFDVVGKTPAEAGLEAAPSGRRLPARKSEDLSYAVQALDQRAGQSDRRQIRRTKPRGSPGPCRPDGKRRNQGS